MSVVILYCCSRSYEVNLVIHYSTDLIYDLPSLIIHYRIQAIMDTGIVPRIVELLPYHDKLKSQNAALEIIGSFVSGDDKQTQTVLNSNILIPLNEILENEKSSNEVIRKTIFIISNIAAGTIEQIQLLIDHKIILKLIILFEREVGIVDILKEAGWSLTNVTSGGTPEQIYELIDIGIIKALCILLHINDGKTPLIAMEGLENILKIGILLDKKQNNGTNENRIISLIRIAKGIEEMYLYANKNRQSMHNYLSDTDDAIQQKAESMIKNYFYNK